MISETLAAVEKNSKILEFFSTAAKDFFFECQKLRQKNLKPLTAAEKKSKILEFFSTAAKDFFWIFKNCGKKI